MSAKYFIDTNIFVYSFDDSQPYKQKRSLALINEALETGAGMISTQVIQEFLNVATQKFAIPLKIDDVRQYLYRIMNPLCEIYPDVELYESCLEIQAETKYSFYDSLIIAAALRGNCGFLCSEDLQDGQMVQGVKITNPYRE